MPKYSLYKKKDLPDDFMEVKHRGKVYTPGYLVNIILDQGHYSSKGILRKHIIDNSCGDGQFMVRIVDRYCNEFKNISSNTEVLKKELETFIHAIEIDDKELNICKERCSKVAEIYGVEGVNWDFINMNAFEVNAFDGKMDFVVGNPPYVRVHNLGDSRETVKNSLFCKNGMTDLYIGFFEIGIKMLNSTGILSYITSSSYFTSLAGAEMRKYFVKNNLLESICNLKHFQAFDATTYTAMTCLNNNRQGHEIKYFEFDDRKLLPKHSADLNERDFFINGSFYFSTKDSLLTLRKIICNNNVADFCVKNGYATLADKIFIQDFNFESKFVIPVIKASRAKWTRVFFPYDENGKLVEESELMKDKFIKEYLLSNKEKLLNRSSEKDNNKYWYAFGRSQGIIDTRKDKLSLSVLMKSIDDLKIEDVPAGCGVYGGLYIVSQTIPYGRIKKALKNRDFFTYVSLLGKYKNGGCYTFSSKDVSNYLNYKLSEGRI